MWLSLGGGGGLDKKSWKRTVERIFSELLGGGGVP